jgi:hypothetical protein
MTKKELDAMQTIEHGNPKEPDPPEPSVVDLLKQIAANGERLPTEQQRKDELLGYQCHLIDALDNQRIISERTNVLLDRIETFLDENLCRILGEQHAEYCKLLADIYNRQEHQTWALEKLHHTLTDLSGKEEVSEEDKHCWTCHIGDANKMVAPLDELYEWVRGNYDRYAEYKGQSSQACIALKNVLIKINTFREKGKP